MGLIGHTGIRVISNSLVSHNDLVDRIDPPSISLFGPISLVDHNGLVGFIGFDLVGFIGIGLISLVGFIGHISLVGLSGLSLIGLISFLVNMAKTKLWWLKHAATRGVASVQLSATKITNATISYYPASLLHACLFVREKMYWWLALARKKMCSWFVSFGEPYHSDVL
jgi:hypothetical protein